MASRSRCRTPSDPLQRDPTAPIAPGELAVVCQRFDLGHALAAAPLARGSRASPKVRLRTDRGDFLIKRRDPARADPLRVAASHEVHLHLVARGYRAPPLIGARADGATALHHAGFIYEVMAFAVGEPFAHRTEQTFDAGARLAEFHTLLATFTPRYAPARGRLHASPRVGQWLHRAAADARGPAQASLRELRRLYVRSAERVDAAGAQGWRPQVVHGDWHPGNLLFDETRVAAVVDFDAVRVGTPAEDAALAAVQFSFLRTGSDPAHWPDEPDPQHLAALLAGFRSGAPWLAGAIPEAIAPLMVEALVSEAVLTLGIASPHADPATREMILRKARWLAQHATAIATLALG